MTWMETFQLLGLDLVALMLMALVVLDIVERSMHSAWVTVRSPRLEAASAQWPSAATHAATVSRE